MRVRGMAINQRLACCCRMSHICRMHFIPIDETINHRGMGTVVDALWLVCRAGEQILECPDLSDANSGNQVQIHPPPLFFPRWELVSRRKVRERVELGTHICTPKLLEY